MMQLLFCGISDLHKLEKMNHYVSGALIIGIHHEMTWNKFKNRKNKLDTPEV